HTASEDDSGISTAKRDRGEAKGRPTLTQSYDSYYGFPWGQKVRYDIYSLVSPCIFCWGRSESCQPAPCQENKKKKIKRTKQYSIFSSYSLPPQTPPIYYLCGESLTTSLHPLLACQILLSFFP